MKNLFTKNFIPCLILHGLVLFSNRMALNWVAEWIENRKFSKRKESFSSFQGEKRKYKKKKKSFFAEMLFSLLGSLACVWSRTDYNYCRSCTGLTFTHRPSIATLSFFLFLITSLIARHLIIHFDNSTLASKLCLFYVRKSK